MEEEFLKRKWIGCEVVYPMDETNLFFPTMCWLSLFVEQSRKSFCHRQCGSCINSRMPNLYIMGSCLNSDANNSVGALLLPVTK